MTARFLLVRHGQIEANITHHWHGSTDSPLTELGRRQAVAVGEFLHRSEEPVAAIYSSPLQRTRHTADAIGERFDMDVANEANFREWGIGELEGTQFQKLVDEHRFFEAVTADHHFAPPGGESLAQVVHRMETGLRTLAATHADRTVVIVSHGAAMGLTLGHLIHAQPMKWLDYSLANCSVTELFVEPEPRLVRVNETGHVPVA